MKRIFLLFLVACSHAFGIWALVPLNDLVDDSDTIITGTLTEVKTWTKDNVDYGSGTLVVDEIIKGAPKTKELHLVWQNHSDIACPRIEHRYSKGKLLIWLLTAKSSGESVEANYPERVLEISERSKVEAALSSVTFKLVGAEKH